MCFVFFWKGIVTVLACMYVAAPKLLSKSALFSSQANVGAGNTVFHGPKKNSVLTMRTHELMHGTF